MKKLTTTSGIVQTALFPDTVKSYSKVKREGLIWQPYEILMNVQR